MEVYNVNEGRVWLHQVSHKNVEVGGRKERVPVSHLPPKRKRKEKRTGSGSRDGEARSCTPERNERPERADESRVYSATRREQ